MRRGRERGQPPCVHMLRKGQVRTWQKAGHLQTRTCPHENPPMLAPGSQPSSLQTCEKIEFSYWSHPVYDILLWQPERTSAIHFLSFLHSPQSPTFYDIYMSKKLGDLSCRNPHIPDLTGYILLVSSNMSLYLHVSWKLVFKPRGWIWFRVISSGIL